MLPPLEDSQRGTQQGRWIWRNGEQYSLWLKRCTSVCRPSQPLLIPGQQDYRAEWQNTTLFLASLGGSCILDGAPTPHLLTKWCQPDLLPPELKTPILSEDLAKRFIVTVVDMLINEDILTRETAKEALGSELHPKLYPVLLAQLDT